MSRVRLASGALSAAVALALTACWPVPGQNPDRTAHNPLETRLTPATVGALDELWSSPPAGAPLRDPVVAGGGVVATTGSGLVRYDARTGRLRWSWQPEGEPAGFLTVGSPFVVDDRILVGFGYGNLGGSWSGAWLDPATGTADPGAAAPGGLTEGVRGSQVASWAYGHGSLTPIAVRYSLVDTATGAASSGLLDVRELGDPVDADLTLGAAHLYSSGVGPVPPETPDGGWRGAESVRALPLSGGSSTCGPDMAPYFACPVWVAEVGGVPTGVVLGPGEQVAYVGTSEGRLVALDAATGAIRWTVDVVARVDHAPALAEGVLYVPTVAGDVVAVDADGCGPATTCAPLWTASTGTTAVATQPAVAGTGDDAVLYVGTAGGGIHAFAAAGCGATTCAVPLWSATTGSAVTGGPIVSGGRVLAGLGDGRMVAFGLPAG